MQFQDEDIEKLARLARLSLTPQEIETYRDQLTSILQYVDQIGNVTIKQGAASQSIESVFREDIESPPEATREELLDAAPKIDEGHISVPSVK